MQHPSFQSFRICHDRISLHLKQALLSRLYKTSRGSWVHGGSLAFQAQAREVTTLNISIWGSSKRDNGLRKTTRRVKSTSETLRRFTTVSIEQKEEVTEAKMPPSFLPNHRLLARAFYRVPSSTPRSISTSSPVKTWEGRKAEDDDAAREKDGHDVQRDAVKDGKSERARDEGSRGATEKSGGSNERAKREFPEAPDTIGMQDERGGKQ